MVSLAEYFEANRYKGKYNLGDRVFGYWNKIPFIGTVGNDSVVNEIEGPRVSIHLDLPIKYEDVVKNIIIVKPKDIKKLVDYGEPELVKRKKK
jgi:hypothetical protein